MRICENFQKGGESRKLEGLETSPQTQESPFLEFHQTSWSKSQPCLLSGLSIRRRQKTRRFKEFLPDSEGREGGDLIKRDSSRYFPEKGNGKQGGGI